MSDITKLSLGDAYPFQMPDTELTIYLSQPPVMIVCVVDVANQANIDAFNSGKVQFSVGSLSDNTISALLKIDGFLDWSDSTYNHCADIFECEPSRHEASHNEFVLFNLILVERKSKMIKAMRMTTSTAKVSNTIGSLLTEHVKRPAISNQQYMIEAVNMMARYSIPDMLKRNDFVTETLGLQGSRI